MQSRKFGALAALFLLVTATAISAPNAGPSSEARLKAAGDLTIGNEEASSEGGRATIYWSTEGSGSCATGNFTCAATGREIGCRAEGAYVKCQYTAGDVGWVHCYAAGGGVTSSFEDYCP